jgi:hypothetical protein
MYAVTNARGTGAALSILMSLEWYARTMGAKGLKLETGMLHVEALRLVYLS